MNIAEFSIFTFRDFRVFRGSLSSSSISLQRFIEERYFLTTKHTKYTKIDRSDIRTHMRTLATSWNSCYDWFEFRKWGTPMPANA